MQPMPVRRAGIDDSLTPTLAEAFPPMPFTQADIDALKDAMTSRKGVRRITFSDGQSAEFDSIDDMLKLLSVMESELATNAGTSRTRYGVVDKGV